jgi:enamine deaminase RidA (YjgF/YER057c/UK114 family)
MNMRQNYSTGAKWEELVGYSRAVRMGNVLEVSGTVASDGNTVIARGDYYGQTKFIINKIQQVLHLAGFNLNNVVRTRIFVTDISQWESVGRAHGEFFVEIEVTAIKE